MSASSPLAEIVRTPDARFEAITDYPWPPRYVEIEPGVRMAYVDAGPRDARETVLLLHGEPMWGYLYRKMIGPLVDAGCRVVVPDLIGFGRSDKFVDRARYTYSAHVAWVTALVRKLDLTRVTIFGQDWGGLIGGRVLAENIERFSRAVMSNTGMPGRGPAIPGLIAQEPLSPEGLRERFGIDWRETLDADDCINPEKVQTLIARGPSPYFLSWRVYSQAVARLTPSKIAPGWCLQPMPAAARAAYDAPFPDELHSAGPRRFPMLVPITADDPERVRNEAAWDVLRKWERPFLTLWGDRCPFTYAQRGAEYRAKIPGARLPGLEHKVFAAGHFTQEDVGDRKSVV
jgi:haloalkane dehalogenase